MKRFLPLALILIVCTTADVFAQITSCTQTLRLARSTYEQGRLHELPTLMTDCFAKPEISGGFTKAERVEAYRLLVLAQIYLEEPEDADQAMLDLLNTDPYFEPKSDVDPAEFVALWHTFRTDPIYRLGVNLMLNGTNQNAVSFNPVSEGKITNQSKIGFGMGVVLEVPVIKQLTASVGLNYSVKKFGSTFEALQNDTTSYSTTTSVETQTWICLPVIAQYQIRPIKTRLNPYVLGGFSVDYLLDASSDLAETRKNVQGIEPSTAHLKNQRNKLNLSLTAGAGIRTRVGGGFVFFEGRFLYGLTKMSSQSKLYKDAPNNIDYKFTDGIFRLNSALISVGYVQNFFHPKKKIRK